MITKYPKNIFKQIGNVLRYNYGAFISFLILAGMAFFLVDILHIEEASLPVVPVTILGGGLAIFLGFRNNAAYDRWWEARKIWGALVNSSRTFGTKVLTFMSMKHVNEKGNLADLQDYQRRMIYRHIAYINSLRLQLRDKTSWDEVAGLLEREEYQEMLTAPNKATFLTHRQGMELETALEKGYIEDFRHMSLMDELAAFYDHQGMAERIKKTVFPFYYRYFTELFLWLFIILLPFSLVGSLHLISIPLSAAISFVFYILDKSGLVTEDPFENRASDTPMSAICNTIERDLRHMMKEEKLPEPVKPRLTRYDVEYHE